MESLQEQKFMYNMKSVFLSLFFLLLHGFLFAQEKSIQLKKENSSIIYNLDSVCVSKKELKRITKSSIKFFKVINNDDYEGYLAILSDSTKSFIHPEKLKRKFKKYKNYNLNLEGDLYVYSVYTYKMDYQHETETMYAIIFRLPDATTIKRRVGFDPVKKINLNNRDDYVGLILILNGKNPQVVIPW